jgi:SAM-dependent methyltransferase
MTRLGRARPDVRGPSPVEYGLVVGRAKFRASGARLTWGAPSRSGPRWPRAKGRTEWTDQSRAGRKRSNYGIDAPPVIRNLVLVAAVGAAIAATRLFGLWSEESTLAPLLYGGIWAGLGCLCLAGVMVWGSKVGKLRERDRFLGSLPWRGDETVLDVGCGRGLLLIGAARRLTTGKAVGVDLWQGEDLSGNRPEATLENARIEGVADRVEVRDGDARRLPFPDGTFDVVVSNACQHNIYNTAERRKAVQEIARVLKPGGRVAIMDIRHTRQYADVLRDSGVADLRRRGGGVLGLLLTVVTLGAIRPGEVVARQREAPAGGASS